MIPQHTSLEEVGDESEKKIKRKRGKGVDSQVGTHDDKEVSPFWDLVFEEVGISDGLLRRMDRAGADDHEDSIIVSGQNPSGIVTGGSDGLLRGRRRYDLVAKQSRLDEGIVLE